MKQKKRFVLVSIFLFALSSSAAQFKFNFDRYHTPDELNEALNKFASANPKNSLLHKIAVSPGKKTVNMIEIGPEVNKKKKTLPRKT